MRTRLRRVRWGLLLALILANATCRSLATQGVPSPPEQPAWCRALPRPEYRSLERVGVSDPWGEISFVLRAAP